MYLDSVPARTVHRVKKGQKFKLYDKDGYFSEFVVLRVNPGNVTCKNLRSNFIESFDMGTLVMMGLEPSEDVYVDIEAV